MDMTKIKKAPGAKGFKEDYWQANYSQEEEMDCIGNVKDHLLYLKTIFVLDFIDISSIIDFGFGLGYFFHESLETFFPHTAYGIEPSSFAYEKGCDLIKPTVASMNLELEKIDLLSWCKKEKKKKEVYDLGICTSVFQYLNKEELEYCLPIMASKVKYLYLTVPTDKELLGQREELNFHDRYAFSRSRSAYQRLLRPHFTFISSRLLESRVHFSEQTTSFTDLLFRF